FSTSPGLTFSICCTRIRVASPPSRSTSWVSHWKSSYRSGVSGSRYAERFSATAPSERSRRHTRTRRLDGVGGRPRSRRRSWCWLMACGSRGGVQPDRAGIDDPDRLTGVEHGLHLLHADRGHVAELLLRQRPPRRPCSRSRARGGAW